MAASKKQPAPRVYSIQDLINEGIAYTPEAVEPTAAPAAPARTWGQALGDTAVQLAEGVNTTLGAAPSLVAPGGAMAGFFRDNADYWRDKQSDVLKQRIAATEKRIQEAGKEGVMSQIGTAVSEYWNDPAQAARLVATNLPSMAATLGTGALAGVTARGVAAARGMGAAGEAALAAQYGTRTAMATNAALNAGGARGEAYEDLKRAALAQGMSQEQAERAALDGSVLPGVVGGVAGAVSGKLGLEKAVLGQATAGAGIRKAAGAFGAELAGEQIEEVAPKITTNYEAAKIDPARALTDDLGRTMVETTIGAGPGAVVAGGIGGARTPAQEAADQIRATEKLPESGALTRAVNAGVESKAQAVEAGAPLVDEQAMAEPEPVDDPVRDQILALPAGARQDALRAYAVVNRDDVAKGVQQYNRKLLDRLLAENQPAPVLGERLTDTDMGAMLGGGGMAGNADPIAGMLGGQRDSTANAIDNVYRAAESRPPMPASDAARMLDEARNRGLDLTVAEHPAGGFVIVPPAWVTPDMAAQGEASLAETIARMQQADAAPVERAPRTSTAPVDLSLPTDPVENFVGNLRTVNTPAARAYVRDFDAGRITPADVQRRMVVEQGVTPDQRIARAAAEAPATADPVADRLQRAAAQGMATPAPTDILNPAGQPFKTRMAADRAAKQTPGAVVPVEGGFVVRPQEPVNVQDAAQGADVTLTNEGDIQPEAAPVEALAPVAEQPAGPAAGVPAEGAAAVEAAGLSPASVEYKKQVDTWNAKVNTFKTANPEQQTAMRPEMDAARASLEQARQGLMRESDAAFKKKQAEQSQKDRAEKSTKYGAMPTGTRIGIAGQEQNDSAYWEKTGPDEWTRVGIGSEQPKLQSADMEGGRVISQPSPAGPAATPAAVEAAGVDQLERERIDNEERIGKPALRSRIAEGREPKYEWNTQEGIYTAKASDAIVGGDANAYKVKLTLTADEKRAVKRADSAMDLADTPEERAEARKELMAALRPAVDRALAEKTTPTTQGSTNATQTAQAQQTSPQPTQAGAAQPTKGLTNAAPAQNDGAQAAPAPGAQAQAPGNANWAALTPEQRRRARLEHEIATGQTNNGGVVASLRPSAIEKRKQELAAMGDAGKLPSPGPAESAEQRTQRVAQAGEAWTRMPTAQREALAGIAAGLNPIQRKRVPSAAWADLNRTIQRNLADAMGGREEFGGNQALALTQQAQAATENVANDRAGQDKKAIRYELPPEKYAQQQGDESWMAAQSPSFKPTARQQLLMDAVAKALDDGAFYNSDVDEHVAKALGVTLEQRARNSRGVEGGDFGFDVYNASRAVQAQRSNAKSREFAKALNLKPGDVLGTLVFNDGKVTTGVKVNGLNDSGLVVTVTGKRGAATLNGEVGIDRLAAAMDRAKERGKRKDGYAEFAAGRGAVQPSPQDFIPAPASASPESESSQGSSKARGQDASAPPTTPEVKADDVEPKIMQSRPNDWPYANYGWVMVGGGRNAPGAASEKGAKIELSKNPEWKERGAVILPFRWNDGGLRGLSPYAETTTRYAILVRQKESPRIEAASETSTPPAAQPDTPKLTPAEAKSLMAWEDLGQKDGVKTHALTFYESQADKDAKRGRMTLTTVSKGDRSATAWMVDGDDQTFGALALAKKRGEEMGMAKAVADGYVEQGAEAPANDRNAFTLQRLNRETGQMEPVTFERGEYVRYTVGGKDQFGDIDGISQARREFSVGGLWHPFGFAYKAERPAAPKSDTAPLSSVIDKVNAKSGQGLTDADRVPEQKPASKTPTIDRHNATMAAVREGKATAEQFKASFEAVVASKEAIKAELDTMTKVQLLREGGPFVQMRYANEKKADVVDAMYREMVGEYALGESVTYSMGKGAFEAAVRKMVEATDADKLANYVTERQAAMEERKAARAAKAAAIENPQTLADFREAINARMRDGMARKEAFLALTPDQRIQYDTLEAESTREARETRKRAQKTQVRAAGQTTAGEIVATKHTRDGYDLFVVKLADRLSADDYKTVLASAKKLGGWYSAFRGNGAIPGFQFKDKANAEALLALAGGDTTAAQEQVAQRRNAFEDDRSQTAVERLRAMADKLESDAAEIEGQQRKTNTERRARFASAALQAAAADKAKAQTMRNIAQAIEAGDAKFLDAVRTKSQVDMLTGIVDTAKGAELRAKYPSYADQEKRKGEPPTAETADFADFPSYSSFRSDLATLGRQMLEVDGTKKLGQRLMSVADDVTDSYLEFAKANIRQVSQFGRGDALADFASKEEAERALKRSGLTGKAIVLPVKRGQNRIILSPGEAIGRGVWKGDGDQRITLTAEFGAELVEAIGRRGNKQNQLSVPWQFQTAYDRRKALARIGIETPSEFRAALREFIALKEQAIANRTRAMELQMVGRKADGLDFFPTSAEVADQMVEAADLSPDMAVLEPSAGMGHLADRIREAGAEPDVIEISADRRELLEEKGYTTQAVDDFLDLKPRGFFTFGDTFRAPDGAEGVMRGASGNRVRLVNAAGDMVGAGYYDRAELTGIAHNGTASGYDRIIMNPPFSNRRDAEHVRHAYSLLKPGGRIVAIMGEGVFFGQDKKAQDFREWLESVDGTSEKLPEGSFMDPSLPVNTSVNARMVVIDKAKGVAMFATASAPVAPGQGITLQAAQQATDKVLDGLGMRGVVVPKVFRNTAAAGISDPGSVMPTGGTSNGEVFLFTDNIHDEADAFKVVFHELFHLGLSQSVKPQEYIQTMLQFLRDPLVRKYANEWKQSKDGRSRLGTLPLNNWHALAVEEALAVIGENLNTDGKGIGTKEMQGWVRRTIAWLADLAQSWKMPAVARKLRGMTYTQAEAFVQATMLKGRTGAPVLLPDTRFRSAADTAQAVGDTLKSITVANVKQRAGFKLTDYLGIGLQALGRRQIVDIYGDLVPLAEYNRLVQQMEADKNEGGAEADQLVTQWAKLDDEGKLADLMHDATLAQIDPAADFVDGDNEAQYQVLQRKYNALSDEAKKVYADTRDAYKAHHAKVRSAIKERIERSEIKGERKAALLKQMDDDFFKAVKGVYFPLARFGQYVVTVKAADGKIESVSRAETKAEAEALRSNLLSAFPRDKGFSVGRVMLSKEFVADRDAVGRGFMTELYQVLDKQDMDAAQRAELEDTLGQLYLSSLPDLSWAKHGIHRKGTPGFSQDARRAYAQNMFHGARYLAKLRYSDLMQDELAAMQRHVDDWREVEDFDQNSAQRVVTEMYKRHESLMNPQSNALSTALTSLGFVFHLGLSPASAMVNLSQTALVAYPIMGAKWGFGKASAALLKASAEAAKGKNDITGSLNEDERAAYDEAVRAGTIDVTMAHDLAGIAQGEDAGVMWKIRPVMRWASFLFHHAERFNRQVTFVAAYRLAREAGADQKAAFEQATKATYDGHFDYGAANRPRIMQGNVAKVLLLFKQYGQNMVYTLARNAQQSMKGETPEARAQARKALGGLLATHAAAAGVLGLPMVTTLLAAASMIGGDDDEPWDAKVALKNMLADTFGQKPAEVMAHGLSRLTPWDISSRVGLDRLIFPDVQEGLEGQRLGEAAMAAALGPVAGIGINVLKGLQDMADGQYQRGLESMMPAALRGPIKAVRYESEGVQDKTGVVVKDEVSAAGVVGQFLGFSPSEVRNAMDGKSAVYQQDKALGERRQELLTKAARATMDKDAEARADAMKEIERFNQKNPTRRITPLNVLQSVRNRQKRIDQAEGGVYLPKNRRDAVEAGRFAVEG